MPAKGRATCLRSRSGLRLRGSPRRRGSDLLPLRAPVSPPAGPTRPEKRGLCDLDRFLPSATLGGKAGLDPVLLATLVVVGVLVSHGRMAPGQRRYVSICHADVTFRPLSLVPALVHVVCGPERVQVSGPGFAPVDLALDLLALPACLLKLLLLPALQPVKRRADRRYPPRLRILPALLASRGRLGHEAGLFEPPHTFRVDAPLAHDILLALNVSSLISKPDLPMLSTSPSNGAITFRSLSLASSAPYLMRAFIPGSQLVFCDRKRGSEHLRP